MSDVFLDSVGLLATWDIRDQWHAKANTAYHTLLEQGRRLVTTPLILWECGNAAARRPYRPRVNAIRHYLIPNTGRVTDPTHRP